MKRHLTLIAAFALFFTANASAVDFYSISGVTSDTAGTDLFPAVRLIEGSGVGFSAAEPHDRASTLTWVTNAPNGGSGNYFAPTPNTAPRLVFDLGSDVNLGEISVWGYADTNFNGMKNFDIRFATDADGDSGFGTSILDSHSFVLDSHLVTPRRSFTFDHVIARFVELTPTDNFFESGAGGDRVGLGEVAFEVTARIIPEPTTAMLGLIGMAGLAIRRRRTVA